MRRLTVYTFRTSDFVFVSTPKCATNSMYQLLPLVFPEGQFDGSWPPKKHKLFTWAIVRNPYDRAVAVWWSTTVDPTRTLKQKYCYVALGTTDFTKFLRFMLTRPHMLQNRHLSKTQAEWLRGISLSRTVHLETLERDLAAIPYWKPGIELPHLNKSVGRKHWTEYMNQERAALVQEWAGDDFERFDYSRDWGPQ